MENDTELGIWREAVTEVTNTRIEDIIFYVCITTQERKNNWKLPK